MFSLATKAMFGLAAVSLVSAVVYTVAVNDDAGMMLLFSVAVVAVVAGLALSGSSARDRDAAPAAVPEPPLAGPSRPSPWPLLSALSLTVLGVGLATGTVLVVGGLLAVAITLAGWLGHSWTEHPTWSAENGARVSERLLSPVALPLGVFALVALIVISFSRVLLAAPSANASTAVALTAAVLVLGGCSLVAARPNLGSSAVIALAAVAGVLTVGAGITGAVAGEREVEHHEATAHKDDEAQGEDEHADGKADASTRTTQAGDEVPQAASSGSPTSSISAEGVRFSTKRMNLPAGRAVDLVFDNQEPLPHNISIRGADDSALFAGDIVQGPKSVTYKVPALDAGELTFRCDVHPQMAGVVVVS